MNRNFDYSTSYSAFETHVRDAFEGVQGPQTLYIYRVWSESDSDEIYTKVGTTIEKDVKLLRWNAIFLHFSQLPLPLS